MKGTLLSGLVVLASATLCGQAPPPSPRATAPAGSTSTQTLTLTGCVGGGGSSALPVTLSNAMVVPNAGPSSSSTGGAAASPVPSAASAPTTAAAQPQAATGTQPPAATGRMSDAAKAAAAAATSYELTGADLTSWIGKRVQIAGSIVPAAAAGSPASSVPGATGTSGSTAIPQFRVQSVQPVSGGPSCPEK